jgi:hypothetical protein
MLIKNVDNMINKIKKERRRSMNATPTRASNKDQPPRAKEDHKHTFVTCI